MSDGQPTTQPTAFDDKTDLRGQVAIVTGASSGIGQAIAEALVRRGAHAAGSPAAAHYLGWGTIRM